MQYENNPAKGFRDIIRKRNRDARPDMVMKYPPTPLLRGRGMKHELKTTIVMLSSST